MDNHSKADNNKLFDAAVAASGGKIKRDDVLKAANGDASALMSSLDEDSRKMLTDALTDKNKARQILNSDAARQILGSILNGGKKNG